MTQALLSTARIAQAVLAAGGEPPHPDGDAIRRHLQDVLSRPEFRKGGMNLAWLAEALRRFFEALGALSGTSPLLFWLLLVACVLLLALIVLHIAWTVRRMLAVAPGGARGRGEAAAQRAGLSRAYRDEARDRAARGDFTEAVRFLFLSLVYFYDEEGRVLFQRAYTNREYLALFTDRPQVGRDLRVFVDVLDNNWYGQRPTDEPHYRECLALYERLLPGA